MHEGHTEHASSTKAAPFEHAWDLAHSTTRGNAVRSQPLRRRPNPRHIAPVCITRARIVSRVSGSLAASCLYGRGHCFWSLRYTKYVQLASHKFSEVCKYPRKVTEALHGSALCCRGENNAKQAPNQTRRHRCTVNQPKLALQHPTS